MPQQGIHTRGHSNLGLQSRNETVTPVGTTLPCKAWSSLKVIHPDTTSLGITKCFLISRQNTRKHTNIGKSPELRIVRVMYQVGQITHRAIIKNKWDQVIVTMCASKTKMDTRTKHTRTRTQSLKDTRAHRSLRLLSELEQKLDSTLDS
jgi:hypothetical protein